MMKMWLGAALLALTVAGCGSKRYVNVIDTRAVSSVQHEIKKQLGLYAAAAGQPPYITDSKGQRIELKRDPSLFACGRGDIDFDILSVKADLNTTIDRKGDAKIAVAVPFTGGSAGPSLEGSNDVQNSQELVYNLWPALVNNAGPEVMNQPIPEDLEKEAPIAAALLSLRNGLIASAMAINPYTGKSNGPQPCFVDFNTDAAKPGGDPGNSFKLGFTVTGDLTIGFEIKLTAVDLSASGEVKSGSGNTITVNFFQRGTYDLKATVAAAAPPRRGVLTKPSPTRTTAADPVAAEVSKLCLKFGGHSWQCVYASGNGGMSALRTLNTVPLRLDQLAPPAVQPSE